MVAFVKKWHVETGIDVAQFIQWLEIGRSKYDSWQQRQGQENQHNAPQPKQYWLIETEKAAIVNYYIDHRDTGYRRLSYMMLMKTWWPSALAASIASCCGPASCGQQGLIPRGKGKDLSSLSDRIRMGTSTSLT